MCNYFQEQTKDSVRQVIFSSLFSPQGNKADDSRMALLGKLVSMAVAVCRVPVLECAAFWLQVLLLCRQECLGEGLRACSRVGTVNWGTAVAAAPCLCSCPFLCSGIRESFANLFMCCSGKIVWVGFFLNVSESFNNPPKTLHEGSVEGLTNTGNKPRQLWSLA